jgi:hypothetical protein
MTDQQPGHAEEAPSIGVDRHYLDQLEGLISQQTSSLEKALLTLSGGAFGLSIVFVTQLAQNPKYPGLMIAAWTLFGIALIFTVVSFQVSITALAREREIHLASVDPEHATKLRAPRHSRRKKPLKASSSKQQQDWSRNPFGPWVSYLNAAAITSFSSGVVALSYFAAVNMLR